MYCFIFFVVVSETTHAETDHIGNSIIQNETHFISFFINYLLHHQKYWHATPFNENGTSIESGPYRLSTISQNLV